MRAQKVRAQGAMTAAAASFLACSAASTALCAARSLRNLQRATKPLMCACEATHPAQVTVLHLKARAAEGKGLSAAQHATGLHSHAAEKNESAQSSNPESARSVERIPAA